MSNNAPDTSNAAAAGTPGRVALARRAEFVLIALGGVFIILGWGIGHQEWARALGWLCAGIGFAIEMVYTRVLKSGAASDSMVESSASDESSP